MSCGSSINSEQKKLSIFFSVYPICLLPDNYLHMWIIWLLLFYFVLVLYFVIEMWIRKKNKTNSKLTVTKSSPMRILIDHFFCLKKFHLFAFVFRFFPKKKENCWIGFEEKKIRFSFCFNSIFVFLMISAILTYF